jgi:signal transduction histidine kinase
MSEDNSPDSGQELSAAARAALAGAVTLVIAGAGLAWALAAAPQPVRQGVAWGGGAAAVVIIAAVTAAAYFADIARRSRRRMAAAGLKAGQLEREVTRLAEETLPLLARRAREGAEAGAVLERIPRPASRPAQRLLEVVAGEMAAAGRHAVFAAADHASVEAEVTRLAGETLPGMIRRVRTGEPADLVLADIARPGNPALQGLLTTVADEVAAAERRGATAMAACASAAARIQAQATRLLAELREMENRHGGDEKVFIDLMELDHRVSQLGRLADSIALLAGGRSGRRWTKPIPMESILRGAMGRIDAYQRVRLHSVSTAAIVGYAAESVMHALAELMDNAAAFSAHGSEVHVYVEEEDVGTVVTVEDSGLGMRKRERGRAEGLVSRPLDLASLPGTRLGLAVVGRVADRYGLSVHFRPSSRGGTGVVVMIPRQLIAETKLEAGVVFPGHAGGLPETSVLPDRETVAADDSGDEDDLPVRPRGRTLAAMTAPGQETDPAPPPRQPRDTGARFAAFRQAGERNRGAAPDGEETT